MDPLRGGPLVVVGLIVVVVAVTGPFGPLSIPTGYSGDKAPGTGTATITITDPPDQPRFEPGREVGGIYYLRVPDVGVEVRDLRGNPTLAYNVRIEQLGFRRGSIHLLGSAGPGRHSISLEPAPFEATRLERDSYNASLELVVRTDGGAGVLYRNETTVVVG